MDYKFKNIEPEVFIHQVVRTPQSCGTKSDRPAPNTYKLNQGPTFSMVQLLELFKIKIKLISLLSTT